MTIADFEPFIRRINHIWGIEFDVEKIKAWLQVLGGLKIHRLMDTLGELALKCKFPPKIAEIVETYGAIRERQAIVSRARQIAAQDKYLADNQHYCFICQNDGVLFIPHPQHPGRGYTCLTRCLCARGKDLNRWSRHQITKDLTLHNQDSKEEESLYVADINDILTSEEIGVIQAKNMSRNHSIAERVDIGGMVQGMIYGLTMKGPEPEALRRMQEQPE